MYELIAMQAVVHVRYVKGIQPSNRASGVASIRRAYGISEAAVEDVARNVNQAIVRFRGGANDLVFSELLKRNRALYLRYDETAGENPMTIRAKALATATTNIGNCEAQASVAFDWLARYRDSHNVRFPIEMWEIGRDQGDDAHVFVVIGRTPADPTIPYTAWTKPAVVCDPWSDDSYPVTELHEHATDIHSTLYPYTLGHPMLKLMYRSESNDRWPWDAEPDHAGALLPVWSDSVRAVQTET